jgi:GT2 family glycosyltransferase
MTGPAISLIIVSYNTRDILRQCLASVADHCAQAEVIVVDNASRDGSVEMVRAEFPRVTLIASPTNDGFAAANNRGLELASGEFVVLLNSDTILQDDGLARCANWMSLHPEIGAASPRIVGVDGVTQECLLRLPSLGEELRTALRKPSRPLAGDRDPNGWLTGTALMIRRAALSDAGGLLDDGYFMYWEDADLSARIRAAGWELAAYPEAQILHLGGASGGGQDGRRRPDLLAWYIYGKLRWFARHRGVWEVTGLWILGWVTVARNLVRAGLRTRRRHEATDARVLAGVLGRSLVGLSPPRPSRATDRLPREAAHV